MPWWFPWLDLVVVAGASAFGEGASVVWEAALVFGEWASVQREGGSGVAAKAYVPQDSVPEVPCQGGRNQALRVSQGRGVLHVPFQLSPVLGMGIVMVILEMLGGLGGVLEKSECLTWEPDFLVRLYLLVASQVFITGLTRPFLCSHWLLAQHQDPASRLI